MRNPLGIARIEGSHVEIEYIARIRFREVLKHNQLCAQAFQSSRGCVFFIRTRPAPRGERRKGASRRAFSRCIPPDAALCFPTDCA